MVPRNAHRGWEHLITRAHSMMHDTRFLSQCGFTELGGVL